jgi:PKD domain/Glycosyl hydrolases family 39
MPVHAFYGNTRARLCSLVLAAASLLGLSAAHAQTVTADFAGRSGSTPVVPAGLFSVGGTGSTVQNSSAINLLTTAGLDRTRFWVSLQQIFATSTPNYSYLDSNLTRMQAAGLHPMAVIYNTPSSLGSQGCSAPSNPAAWGKLAASVVAHVDQKFPGLMRDYEVWNEPELPASLCVTDATARLNAYVSMFAAAGSAMHAQATLDGQTIRVGGPVISQLSLAPTWLSTLLNNPSAAPNVDFVSFHLYITGLKNIQSGMTWAQLYGSTQSSNQGLAHYYHLIESAVRAGHQPNAASTPIYISEYNNNWAYAVDCCRNDATYAPLWNSLAVTDLLNVVYTGAKAGPSQLSYFNSAGKYFCILGKWDSAMDCDASATDPYPQFFAYKLFASPNYLGLQAGGHMAASVSPASTTSGLTATAFYTSQADNVVVINPTPTSYGAVTVALNNSGFAGATGTVYLLNKSNGQITTQSVTLTPVSGGYSAQLAVPAYSTVALSIAGTPVSSQPPASPVAVLTVTPVATQPRTVTADSSASQGGGSAIAGRTISFGDGTWISWTPTLMHTYAKAGTYSLTLTIKNQAGQTAATTAVATVQ